MGLTKIPWCDRTVNPIKLKGGGFYCDPISVGCQNCFASSMNVRFFNHIPYGSLRDEPEFELDLSVFDKLPKKPKRVFVQSMGDLFHRCVPFEMVDEIMNHDAWLDGHKCLILTKRIKRMAEYVRSIEDWVTDDNVKHIWLGVTVCNQKEADEKIPVLLSIPAAVRFVSIEPMLGPVDFRWAPWHKLKKKDSKIEVVNDHLDGLRNIDWIILGCESGSKRRPSDVEWMKNVVGQCCEADVACFVKQVDVYGQLIKDISKFPIELQIQEIPKSNP